MTEVSTIGLDLAKNVFQVHGVDEAGEIVVRRQLRRSQVISFLRSCRRVWWASRPAQRRIIGLASCKRSVMRYASCRRIM